MRDLSHRRTLQGRRLTRLIGALFAFALIAAACGGDDDEAGEETVGVETASEDSMDDGSMEDRSIDDESMDEDMDGESMDEDMDGESMDEDGESMDEDMMDLSGTTVSVFGPESSEVEAGAIQDALDVFAEKTGIVATYTGARDFSEQINAQAAGGNPPDIAVFPQPGKVGDFGAEGWILPIHADVQASVEAQWPAGTLDTVTFGGTLWGVPNKTALKSNVWYNTQIFSDGGYSVPQSFEEIQALTLRMVQDGITPWCVGIESGPATGWPFTDWMEDMILRVEDENVYDQWVAGEIPFSDPRIISIAQTVLGLWNLPGAIYAAGGSVAATPFGDNAEPLVAGDCAMHRQATFFASFFPEGTEVGPGGDIDVFYFPALGAKGNRPVLTSGTYVSAFRDAPEVWAVMEYFGSAEYANERQKAQAERAGSGLSGYLSANTQQDLSLYNDLERSFVEILQTASPARFDGSDLMPAAVGAGTFWTEGTSAVNGDKTLEEAFAAIDDSWPR